MSEKLIRSLFEGRLKTWAAARSPALQIAWENVAFTPPAGEYLQAFLLRGDATSRDLAGDNRNRVGVFQINVNCKRDQGAGVAEGIAAELDALFPMNLRLASGAFWVLQTSPLRTRGVLQTSPQVDRYIVPVDFAYMADEYPV